MILNDVKELLNKTVNSTGLIINNSLLYDLIFFIEEKNIYKDKKSGIKISVSEFKEKFNLDETIINRHINHLLENSIVWRSKLEYDIENNIREIYRYDLNCNIKLSSLDRFIYTTIKEYNKVKESICIVDNETKINLHKNLQYIEIDVDNSLKDIYDSNMELKGKKLQSLYIFQCYFKNYYISQKESDKRIYHTITSMSSKLHKHLYINNIKVSSIDAKQSQLVLLSLLTKDIDENFYTDVHTSYIYDNIINYYKELINKECMITNNDIKFKYLDSNYIPQYINVNDLNKDIIKPIVYAALFSGFNNKGYNTVTEYFKIKYPKLVEYININFPKENKLAAKLQSLEASIWLTAFNNLSNKNIITIPKHDNLFFKYYDSQIVLLEIIKQFKRKGLEINKSNYEQYLDLNIVNDRTMFNKINIEVNILEDFNEEYSKFQQEIQKEIQKEINHSEIQKEIGNTDLTIYNFINKDGERFNGIKSEFIKIYNLDKSAIRQLISGKLNTSKGWKLDI